MLSGITEQGESVGLWLIEGYFLTMMILESLGSNQSDSA
jgi:hypothetical protein